MSVLVLVALVGGAFALNLWRDRLDIAQVALQHGWRELRIAWAPLARLWTSRRGERHYWLAYLDEAGRSARRLCCVKGFLQGTAGVFLEPAEGQVPAPARPLGRAARIALWAGGGAFVGYTLGVGACLLLFPTSNIAPVYGIFLTAPLGLLVGGVIGALRMP